MSLGIDPIASPMLSPIGIVYDYDWSPISATNSLQFLPLYSGDVVGEEFMQSSLVPTSVNTHFLAESTFILIQIAW